MEGLDAQEHVLGALDAFMPRRNPADRVGDDGTSRAGRRAVSGKCRFRFISSISSFEIASPLIGGIEPCLPRFSRPRALAYALETGAPLQPRPSVFSWRRQPIRDGREHSLRQIGKRGLLSDHRLSNPEMDIPGPSAEPPHFFFGLESIETDLVLEAVVAALGGDDAEQRVSFFINKHLCRRP